MIADFFFVLFAVMAIGGATAMVIARNPLASLLYLVMAFFSMSGIFVLLDAHFIAAVNLIVYAGAILVLFLFVIMLLNLGGTEGSDLRGPIYRMFGIIARRRRCLRSPARHAARRPRDVDGRGHGPGDDGRHAPVPGGGRCGG
jgi:hypothetical protein